MLLTDLRDRYGLCHHFCKRARFIVELCPGEFQKRNKKCIRRVPESEFLAKLVLTVAWILVDKENLLPYHLSTHYQLSIVDKDFDQSTNC